MLAFNYYLQNAWLHVHDFAHAQQTFEKSYVFIGKKFHLKQNDSIMLYHCLAEIAFIKVSCVVNVLDAITNRVVSGQTIVNKKKFFSHLIQVIN